MNKLAGMLHSLCCERQHSEDMQDVLNPDDPKCHFYLEQTIDGSWAERDHVLWTNEARRFIEDLEAKSPEEAFDILRQVMNIIRAAEILLEKHPTARGMLVKLLS